MKVKNGIFKDFRVRSADLGLRIAEAFLQQASGIWSFTIKQLFFIKN